MDAVVRPRGNVELERDLVHALALGLRIEVELDVQARLDLPGINLRRAGIFDRKIFDILRKDRNLRLSVVVRAVAARSGFLVRHYAVLTRVCAAIVLIGSRLGIKRRGTAERLAAAFMRRNGTFVRWSVLEYLR